MDRIGETIFSPMRKTNEICDINVNKQELTAFLKDTSREIIDWACNFYESFLNVCKSLPSAEYDFAFNEEGKRVIFNIYTSDIEYKLIKSEVITLSVKSNGFSIGKINAEEFNIQYTLLLEKVWHSF